MSAPIIIYVAGPFRAPNAWEIEQNIREAERVGLEIARAGAIPFIPHTMYRFFQYALPDEFWLSAGLELLRRCDAIMLLRRWRESSGTRNELAEASLRSMPSMEYDRASLSMTMAVQKLAEEVRAKR